MLKPPPQPPKLPKCPEQEQLSAEQIGQGLRNSWMLCKRCVCFCILQHRFTVRRYRLGCHIGSKTPKPPQPPKPPKCLEQEQRSAEQIGQGLQNGWLLLRFLSCVLQRRFSARQYRQGCHVGGKTPKPPQPPKPPKWLEQEQLSAEQMGQGLQNGLAVAQRLHFVCCVLQRLLCCETLLPRLRAKAAVRSADQPGGTEQCR